MKITKQQLKKIILEEKNKLLSEVEYFGTDIDMIAKELMSMLRSQPDIVARNSAIYDIIDQLEEQGYISHANHVGKRELNYDKINQ